MPKKRRPSRPTVAPRKQPPAPAAAAKRPLPTGSWTTPGAGPLRREIERRSAAPLVFLHQAPRWGVLLIVGGLLIVGLALAGPIGFVALLLIAGLMGWLSYLAWPQLAAAQRAMRTLSVLVVLGGACWQLVR